MRVILFALAVLATIPLSSPVLAQKIDNIQVLNQQEFRLLSEDLGGALSYRPQTPSEPLGFPGFDLGLAFTGAKIKNEEILERATTDEVPDTLPIPSLRAHLGLPLGFDIGAMYSAVPSSNVTYYGGELKWAFVPGGTLWPAFGVRGAFTKVTGVEQMDLGTRSLDLSISKGIAFATPYAGVGRVWVKSDPKGTAGLQVEEFELDKVFIGIGFTVVALNLNLEADKTGDVTAVSVKAGLRF
ncbi:MAG TPA: hypothetical protein VJQ58_03645 [Burkholderiales bacterium]|nr:hypothetical protein [Burkholderiales bacterium]